MERRSDRDLPALDDALIAQRTASRGVAPLKCAWRTWPEALSCRIFDGELVVHNDATGNTHHLSSLGSAILWALLQQPAGLRVTDLVSRLRDSRVLDEQTAPSVVERTLRELAELELVSCVPA